MIFFKFNFLRIVQHEITHIILRGLANYKYLYICSRPVPKYINISTPEILNKNKVILNINEFGQSEVSGQFAHRSLMFTTSTLVKVSFIKKMKGYHCVAKYATRL